MFWRSAALDLRRSDLFDSAQLVQLVANGNHGLKSIIDKVYTIDCYQGATIKATTHWTD
jgi:hypothetical protein